MHLEGRSRQPAADVGRVAPLPLSRRRRARSLPHRVTIALLIAAVSIPVFADYRDAFVRGIRAQRNLQWQQVAAAMREAIRDQANDSGERIPISGFGDRVPYTPNFWLAIALYHLNDCPNALDAFRNSENSGGWQRVSSSDRGRATKFRQECEAKLVAEKPPIPPKLDPPKSEPPKSTGPAVDATALNAGLQAAEAAINRAQQAQNVVADLSSDQDLAKVWRSEGALGTEEQRAKDNLTRARGELDAGRKESNLQRLQDAATLASGAAKAFEAVGTTARARREELRAVVTTPPVPPDPKAPDIKVPEPPKSSPFVPPAPLVAAANLVFKARYQEAAARLDALKYTTGPAAGHTALLRAATQYSLYLIGGERDQNLLAQARQAVADTRRHTPNLRPDPNAFSPRFVQFFSSESRR